MKCENIFCIYQENGICKSKNKPDIDWRGFCKNLVPVRVQKNRLNTEKMLTQLNMKDGKHYFDREKGIVTLTDDAIKLLDSDFSLE